MSPILGIWASAQQPALNATSYESIATVTVGAGGSSSITFSSIPSTYKHLQIRANLSTGGLGWVQLQFNSDTANNYSQHELRGDGSSASAAASANAGSISSFLQSAQQSSGVIDILDYADTNKYKTTRTLGGYDNNGSGYISLTSGSWRNTAAINTITITSSSSNFAQYSKIALYGVKGA